MGREEEGGAWLTERKTPILGIRKQFTIRDTGKGISFEIVLLTHDQCSCRSYM